MTPQQSIYPFLLPIVLIILSILFLKSKHGKNLPPSPPSLPVIGHLHLVSLPLHRCLGGLSKRFGSTLLLRFGSRPILVTSSPSAVEECFTKNDVTFANRPCFPHLKYITYNHTSLAIASYGPSFRNLRRIATVEIFSPARIRSLSNLVNEEVKLMINELLMVGSADGNFTKMDMNVKFSELMFNIIMKIIAGKRYFGPNIDCPPEEGRRFRGMITELFDAVDTASPQDFLPFLRWFGFTGLQKRLMRLGKEMDQLFQELVEERRREEGIEDRTVIDVMLSMQESDRENYSDEIIKGMVLTLIGAGIHTASGTMEWAMSLLLNHPEALQKVKEEIDKQVGHDRFVDYSDIQNLSYLNNVIKETLRLFPPAPLLLPHESSNECTVEGFHIPSETILFANAYAIHRDHEIWTEPTVFKPERFYDGKIHASKIYFPFGLGRRSCPGEGLARQAMSLALAALVQCFEWERISNEEVDMNEGPGLTLPKAQPLEAICKQRKDMIGVFSKLQP